ncbi:unnamed protein product [marine sediment metagenome]|uniref:MPN domain-containing protein n=1 Tax=marine sediment metagenome TaxID=412755 RepID=X1LQN8_9ZZZZ
MRSPHLADTPEPVRILHVTFWVHGEDQYVEVSPFVGRVVGSCSGADHDGGADVWIGYCPVYEPFFQIEHPHIDSVDLFEGTLENIPIRPREIVEGVIKHSAAAVIFVHNHPSGNPEPSQSDKELTRDLVYVDSQQARL